MSTITAILEPSPDGSLHLPLPEELRDGPVKVVATLSPAIEPTTRRAPRRAGMFEGQMWMAPDFDAPLEVFRDYM